ncbi:MAG TPA: PH domain-containing protein [Anaeromyxobacteraceae bacterium]|nr:PH domain-containing protein [Anaeromyxobacteraceae bacterium]
MQLILAFAVLGSLLIAGGMLLRPVPPAHLRGQREGQAVVLRPPRGRYAILAAMALGPTVLVAVVAGAAARKEALGGGGLALVALAVAAGIGVSLYFLLAERAMRVRVDEAGVERIDPFRRRRIGWAAVERLAYNGVSRWFFVTGPAGTKLWIPENMAGIGDFAEAALGRVRAEVLRADGATHEALQQLAAEAREEDASARRAAP